jgi:hypothetical protein
MSVDVRAASASRSSFVKTVMSRPSARVEVEVALRLVVEVRLLEDERHAQHAFPEVDRRLPVGADDGDVVHALALELPHQRSTSFDL